MNISNYDGFIYSILIALSILLYLKQIGDLIKMRRYAIYYTVPILWTFVFILLLITTYQQQITLDLDFSNFGISTVIIACYYWIGMLLFPEVERLDKQNQFAYLDYYEHFRKQRRWIMGLALIAFCLSFWSFYSLKMRNTDFYSSLKDFLFTQQNFLRLGILLIAFFTEHKGQMLLLVWGLIVLLLFY